MAHFLDRARQGVGSVLPTLHKALQNLPSLHAALSGAAQLNRVPSLETTSSQKETWPTFQPKVEEDVKSVENFQWVFLGCPGVGKGTYASRLSKLLDIPHISTGDLVRAEVKRGTATSAQLDAVMRKGQLIPDDIIFELLTRRLEHGAQAGEGGFILDGFPRTTIQAEILDEVTTLDLVVNLKLREEVLVGKCIGRRTCGQCGNNFNVADIYLKGENGAAEIIMPPLLPPPECLSKMLVRADDTEEVVKMRLENYKRESQPVEEYYRRRNLLLDFDIHGGIPETWPRLLAALGVGERAEEAVPKAA